jgi:hypothetical protein
MQIKERQEMDKALIASIEKTLYGDSMVVDLFGWSGKIRKAFSIVFSDKSDRDGQSNRLVWAHAWSDIIIAASEILKEQEDDRF